MYFGLSEDQIFFQDNVKKFLEDQAPSLRAQITSVPIILLLDKNGKPRGQWKAGLSFKIEVPVEEIQNRVNVIMLESSRRRATSN